MKKSGVSVENSKLYIANIISKVFPWSYPFILEKELPTRKDYT
jgi:hypothetical protein